MPFTSSPYIDGNTTPQNRAIWVEGGLQYTGVYPNENLLNNGRLKTTPDRFLRLLNSCPVNTSFTEAIRWDVTNVKFIFLRIENASSSALNDFIIDGTAHIENDGGFWEELVNGDSFFTTGTGEQQGNQMVIVRKCSPVNPRSLPANGTTWLALNVEYLGGVRIRAKAATAPTTLTIRSHHTFL